MSLLRDHMAFTNPWTTQPAAGSDRSLPCLDGACQLEFPDHDTRYEHYVASHPYSRPSSYGKKPLKCRLCRKTCMTARGLKSHIKLRHRPIGHGPATTQEDHEALVLQSHASTTDKGRSEAQKGDGNIQGHRTQRPDEDPQEEVCPVPSRRSSLLANEVVHYLKRKGSQLLSPVTKKARNASIAKPHVVTPAATEGREKGPAIGVGLDPTLPSFGPRTGWVTWEDQGTGEQSTNVG